MSKLSQISFLLLSAGFFFFGSNQSAFAQAIESHIVSDFSGVANGNIYKLANGQYWEQTSYDISHSSASSPTVIISSGFIYWEMQIWDGGTLVDTVNVQQRIPFSESRITSTFNGFSRDNLYTLANGQIWEQSDFSTDYSSLFQPNAVVFQNEFYLPLYELWVDGMDQMVDVDPVNISFLLSGVAGDGGSITPSNVIFGTEIGSQTFTALPSTGYEVDMWFEYPDFYGEWSVVQTGGVSYAHTYWRKNEAIGVVFKKKFVQPTIFQPASGEVFPASLSVEYGSECIFTVKPSAPWYKVQHWMIDGDVQAAGETNCSVVIIEGTTVSVLLQEAYTLAHGTPYRWYSESGFDILVEDPEALDIMDSDGDGHHNWEEYIAGTSPTNGASVLRLNSRAISGANGVELFLPSLIGRTYDFEVRTNLVSGAWRPLVSGQSGTDSELLVEDTEMHGNRFYRVKVELAE
jgi:hypothetical protein